MIHLLHLHLLFVEEHVVIGLLVITAKNRFFFRFVQAYTSLKLNILFFCSNLARWFLLLGEASVVEPENGADGKRIEE